MERIKFGDIEYFTLLNLRDKLKYIGWNKLDLVNLDRLRAEIEIKIEVIHLEDKQRRIKEGFQDGN